jgi:hypothetical protein
MCIVPYSHLLQFEHTPFLIVVMVWILLEIFKTLRIWYNCVVTWDSTKKQISQGHSQLLNFLSISYQTMLKTHFDKALQNTVPWKWVPDEWGYWHAQLNVNFQFNRYVTWIWARQMTTTLPYFRSAALNTSIWIKRKTKPAELWFSLFDEYWVICVNT